MNVGEKGIDVIDIFGTRRHVTYRWVLVSLSAVALAATSWAGCATFEGASPGRGLERRTAPPSIDWPPRHTGPLLEVARKPLTLNALVQMDRDDWWEDHYIVGKTRESLPRTVQLGSVFRGAYGVGTVCDLLEDPADPGPARTGRFRFVTNWYPPAELEAVRERYRASSITWARLFVFNATTFEVKDPEGAPRGMVFCVSSWGGQEREKPVAEELLSRGWAVVSSSPPVKSRVPYEILVRGDDDLPRAARETAREIDDRLADAAYAVEGALEYLREARPDLPQSPLFVIGYSAGAQVVPAVAARLGSRLSGVVLVGAGSNLLKSGLESTFGGQPLRLVCDGEALGASAKERLNRLYLEASRLDPHRTAAYCRSLPFLMLQARWDRIVPAEGGEALHERLGKPDRYLLPFGHTWLFFRLPAYRRVIADWIEMTSRA